MGGIAAVVAAGWSKDGDDLIKGGDGESRSMTSGTLAATFTDLVGLSVGGGEMDLCRFVLLKGAWFRAANRANRSFSMAARSPRPDIPAMPASSSLVDYAVMSVSVCIKLPGNLVHKWSSCIGGKHFGVRVEIGKQARQRLGGTIVVWWYNIKGE